VSRRQLHGLRNAEMLLHVRLRSQQSLLSPPHSPIRMVRSIFDPTPSGGAPLPHHPRACALSVAPVPLCHESRCAPTITISSFLLPPGISPIQVIGNHAASDARAFRFHLQHHFALLPPVARCVKVFRSHNETGAASRPWDYADRPIRRTPFVPRALTSWINASTPSSRKTACA